MNWLKDSAAACTACKDMVFKIFIYVTDDIKKSLLVADSLSSMEQSIALKYRLLQLNLSIQFTHFEVKGVIVTVITMWLSVYSSIFLIALNSVIFYIYIDLLISLLIIYFTVVCWSHTFHFVEWKNQRVSCLFFSFTFIDSGGRYYSCYSTNI